MEKIDLHLHTNFSDGTFTPEELVIKALNNKCMKISITDHDFAANYNYLEKKYKIQIIPGIEFNTSFKNMHILGYGIKNIDKINDDLRKVKEVNQHVCFEVIELLKKDGYDISIEKVYEYLNNINLSYEYIDKRKLVKYLIYKGYSNTILETYDKLIGVGQKYYVPNKKIHPYEVMNLIDECGGISVLAHPNTLNLSDYELNQQIKKLKENGLSGIEIINSKISDKETMMYELFADELELVKTVGSDFHDGNHDNIGIEVSEEIYENFQKRLLLK